MLLNAHNMLFSCFVVQQAKFILYAYIYFGERYCAVKITLGQHTCAVFSVYFPNNNFSAHVIKNYVIQYMLWKHLYNCSIVSVLFHACFFVTLHLTLPVYLGCALSYWLFCNEY